MIKTAATKGPAPKLFSAYWRGRGGSRKCWYTANQDAENEMETVRRAYERTIGHPVSRGLFVRRAVLELHRHLQLTPKAADQERKLLRHLAAGQH